MEQYEIDYIKSNLQSYLETKGIRTDKFFTCINPKHSDQHPSMKYFDDYKIHCFGCGATYDLFGAIAAIEHLDRKEAFKKAIDYYERRTLTPDTIIKQKTVKNEQKPAKNYEKAYKYWQNALKDNFEAQEYLLSRGIDLATANRFGLGFNSFYFEKTNTRLNAITIPLSKNCFSARNINPNEEMRYYKTKDSDVDIFNKQAMTNKQPICAITEGEFDCLSFETLNVNCVGLGSANNVNLFIESEKDKNKTFIIALDNDEAGQKWAQKLKEYFKENKIKFAEFDNCGYKDPNEALVKDKSAFSKSIFSLIKKLEKQNNAEM